MIVIDPGHGGVDPGATASTVREKDLALVYALTLAGELARLGMPVVMTRERDEMPGGGTVEQGLAYRAASANDLGAAAFLSIHFNASVNLAARGIWLLHMAGAPGGLSLAKALQRELGGLIYPDASPATGGRRLYVLRRTRMPAVLIECGFLTHPAECAELQTAQHMRTFVARTAVGLQHWLASN